METSDIQVVLGAIAGVVTALGSALAALLPVLVRFLKRPRPVIVAVLTVTPPSLEKYPDFTSLRKARRCTSRVAVVHVRSLSYALRKADFVCAEKGYKDCKIYRPNDKIWETLVAEDSIDDSS